MRSYNFNIDKIVNRLVPHYMGGRKTILFLQGILSPLATINRKWLEWANNKRIEAAMTSQVIMLEYYLNRLFSQYLINPKLKIYISEGGAMGLPLYRQDAQIEPSQHAHFYYESEQVGQAMYWSTENGEDDTYSFIVCCPAINTEKISEAELAAMISYQVRKYCISGKKFNVKFV